MSSSRHRASSKVLRVSQFGDAGDLVGWYNQMLMIAPDPELGTLPDVLLPGPTSRRGIVDPDIQHEHTALILAIVPTHIGQRPRGLDHNGDPVQLPVTRMKNVT